VVAAFFVVMTVPLARLTDWLQRRLVERERAGTR
jgi:polar amino acid transport system permease protein